MATGCGCFQRLGAGLNQDLFSGPPANAGNLIQTVTGHVAELDVGAFEQLLNALNQVSSLLDQGASVAHQFATLAALAVGNEASFEQAVLQQFGQPLGVLDGRSSAQAPP